MDSKDWISFPKMLWCNWTGFRLSVSWTDIAFKPIGYEILEYTWLGWAVPSSILACCSNARFTTTHFGTRRGGRGSPNLQVMNRFVINATTEMAASHAPIIAIWNQGSYNAGQAISLRTAPSSPWTLKAASSALMPTVHPMKWKLASPAE